jgi:hypothetical protein
LKELFAIGSSMVGTHKLDSELYYYMFQRGTCPPTANKKEQEIINTILAEEKVPCTCYSKDDCYCVAWTGREPYEISSVSHSNAQMGFVEYHLTEFLEKCKIPVSPAPIDICYFLTFVLIFIQ